MNHTVFIHTNEKQWVGAKVAEYSIRKASPNREKFAISILRLEDHDALCGREGQTYLRDRRPVLWRNGDLQSFTPLRFLPPQLMSYEGRAVVIDPDVFALSDIYELLTRDMKGKAILCKPVYTAAGRFRYHASSVMLLDCSRLRHWRWQDQIEEMFTGKRDYRQWIWLLLEPSENIGPLEEEWNHFDRLDENTKLLHNTQRLTQPWKTGLPIDFTRTKNTLPQGRKWGIIPRSWLVQTQSRILSVWPGRYQRHPDPDQERFFFSLLRECLEAGHLTESLLRSEIEKKHLRPDTLSLLETATGSQPLAP